MDTGEDKWSVVCTYTHQLHLVHGVHPSITVFCVLFYSRSGRCTDLHIYMCASIYGQTNRYTG